MLERIWRSIRVVCRNVEHLTRSVERLSEQIGVPMAFFGYARVSTTDQDFGVQEAALRAAGCETIRSEKKSGTERGIRTELRTLLDFLRKGDTLVVTWHLSDGSLSV